MNPQAINGQILPGSLITGIAANSFPAAAEVRWLETPFVSTDPASVNFLTPDWNDTLVQKYIINKGWAKSGVRDPDGSAADLGAIPQGGGRPVEVARIIPTAPVLINGTAATVNFTLSKLVGSMTSPSIKLHRWVGNLPYDAGPWSNGWTAGIIQAANSNDVAAPAVVVGANTYTFTLPVTQATSYGFLELLIEGTGSNSLPYTSSVGFIPYRKLDYEFVVDILDPVADAVLTEVRAGDTVVLRICAYKADGTIFPNTVNPTEVRLQSGFALYSTAENPVVALTLPSGVPGTTIGSRSNVMFTMVPQLTGGYETVLATGRWTDGANTVPFLGASAPIKILPGPPETVSFQNPPSVKFQVTPPVIDPGLLFPGLLYVYDRFGNRVNASATVNLSSLSPSIGDIVPPVTIATDTTGAGHFGVEVTNGLQGEIFKIRADLTGKLPDSAWFKVGAVSTINKPSSLLMTNRNQKEFSVTFYDLRGRLVYSRSIKSSASVLGPEKLVPQLKRGLTPAVYLVQISEKGPLSSRKNHRTYKLLLR